MCGIVGYIGSKDAAPVILDGLKRLEYRGYDSAGIAVAGNGDGLQVRRAAGKLCNLEEVVRENPLDGFARRATEPLHRWMEPMESGIPAGPRMDILPSRMPIHTGIALERLWWCITALLRTTSN